jgi:hypothetical protein
MRAELKCFFTVKSYFSGASGSVVFIGWTLSYRFESRLKHGYMSLSFCVVLLR